MLVRKDLGVLILGQLLQVRVGLAQKQVDEEPEELLKSVRKLFQRIIDNSKFLAVHYDQCDQIWRNLPLWKTFNVSFAM